MQKRKDKKTMKQIQRKNEKGERERQRFLQNWYVKEGERQIGRERNRYPHIVKLANSQQLDC